MKAVAYEKYGAPELREVDPPGLIEDGLLVRVRASALNALDWYFASGTPYAVRLMGRLAKPGMDFSGTVEAIGAKVTRFQPGDEVLGAMRGALAEYVCVSEDRAVPKPARSTFEQAAAVPVAGLTALQGLRDYGRVRPGHQVLIHGASGGVGTFAVQIAKALGAEVTGVCSTKSLELVRSIGADHVVDYTREDFTRSDRRYDVMLDIGGGRSWSDCRRVLKRDAIDVIAGGPRTDRWFGPMGHLVKVRLASLGAPQRVVAFVAKMRREDLLVLIQHLEAGTVTPVVDRTYAPNEIADAVRHVGTGHPRGKIVIVW